MKRVRKSSENDYAILESSKTLGWIPPSVALSLRDKADGISVSRDQLICRGPAPPIGGFRMIRATHGANHGSYFWECEILKPCTSSLHPVNVRVGWSTSKGELNGPVGYDKYSYCYRDIQGSKVHDSVRQDEYGEPFGPGDIIGCLITLDDFNPYANNSIKFFKNGIDQGIAFKGREITPGIYFPAVSLFQEAVIRVNFGPTFICKYELVTNFNPMSELQPMSPADRKIHDTTVAGIKKMKKITDNHSSNNSNINSLQLSYISSASSTSRNRSIVPPIAVALTLDVARQQHEQFLKNT